MIDEVLDWIYNKKTQALERRTKRLTKYHAAALELHKVKSKMEKIKPKRARNRTYDPNRPSMTDKLADFGERCAKASEKMNQDLFSTQEK